MLITPLIAAICALMYVYLSIGVIRYRLGTGIGLGFGDNADLRVAIRAHANFSEYVPLALILLWFIETVNFQNTLALILGCVLVVGRISHLIGLRKPKTLMICRQLGMAATFSVILICAGSIIWSYLPITGVAT